MPLTKFRRGRTWYLRGTVRGQRIYETCGTTDEARAEALRIRREGQLLDRSIFGDKATRTYAEAALSYLEARPGLATLDEGYVLRTVDHLGTLRLAQIDGGVIAACAAKIYPDAAPATVNRNCLAPIAAVLHHAAELGWMDWVRVKRRKVGPDRVRWLQPAEADRLVAACADELRPIVIFLLYTGARVSEALDLDWRHVDLTRRRVAFVDTKNMTSRGVPLHERVVVALANLPRREGRVFISRLGKPYGDEDGRGRIQTGFEGACRRAKITDFTPHDCRHTWATWLYAECRDLRKLMELGGWKSITMVLRYAHVNPDHLQGAIDLLPAGGSAAPAADAG